MQHKQPLKIFIVYAREDAEALKELRVQFIPVARSERLEVWYDGEIMPGQHWDKEIKAHLQSADIILLFISKYFFASDYIQTTELKEALERHEAGKSVVVPVVVRPCVWQDDFEVSKFQALPTGGQPIFSSAWRDHDEAMVSVVEGIKKLASSIRSNYGYQENLHPQLNRSHVALSEKELNEEDEYWKRIRKLDVKEIYEKFIRENPNHPKVAEAAKRIRWQQRWMIFYLLFAGISMTLVFLMMRYPDSFGVKIQNTSKTQKTEEAKTETQVTPSAPMLGTVLRKSGFEMVSVSGGTFIMGCKHGRDSECEKDEKPAHEVTLSLFNIGMYEVTQADWLEIMGSNPSFYKGCDDCPVENVSWNDIQDFLLVANANFPGKNYRLPTEAEWEFSARGGNQSKGYKYSGGDILKNVAWFDSNSDSKTHPVGRKKSNELGIFDMSGNVWEWCGDWYCQYSSRSQLNPTGPPWGWFRVPRGGSWDAAPRYTRTAHRGYYVPGSDGHNLGFRLASSTQ